MNLKPSKKLLILMMLSLILSLNYSIKAQKNHIYPASLTNEIETALGYFPQLEDVKITFKFKPDIKKSTMQAQPRFMSLFRSRPNREYFIFISEKFKIKDNEFKTLDIPSDVITGWIGHELGHVLDYENRSSLNLFWFGFKYLLLKKHIIEAERAADTFAVRQGMEDYILKTKNFILNHVDIDQTYKARIMRYYLSPEEIMQIVQNREI